MPTKNKRNKRNTRKVKRGGNKEVFDKHVKTITKHVKLDLDVQNAMLEIAVTDKIVIQAYMLDKTVIKSAIIPTLIGKLNTILENGKDSVDVSLAGKALRQIKAASDDSPVFEFRSPLHRPHTPPQQTRKKSPSSSS